MVTRVLQPHIELLGGELDRRELVVAAGEHAEEMLEAGVVRAAP